MKSVNPATGEILASFEELSAAQVEEKLGRAVQAFAAMTPCAFRGAARSRL